MQRLTWSSCIHLIGYAKNELVVSSLRHPVRVVGLLLEVRQAMTYLRGGVRFRYMDLFGVGDTQILLYACAETLETLRLYPADPWGKQL